MVGRRGGLAGYRLFFSVSVEESPSQKSYKDFFFLVLWLVKNRFFSKALFSFLCPLAFPGCGLLLYLG